ncbi:hypothetical protein Atep_12330 [Allochromatium tepidum]|uniref:HDOD domain-containing protein n=1 Tax=Allochromatium tepidum TaxID=553982 RepID=A0ABN6GFA1_9GAMM|nr:hypothetical protein Atep_12330 [Allochromatium tepidum]
MSINPSQKSGLEAWLEVIRDQKMPIFEQTVHHILSIAEDDLAPASALASVVLQDASLTARLLKLANSIAYNPSTTAISTVTRAVIVLGFDAVRDMCLTLTLVDTLLQGPAKARLERELAHAMHAATQATPWRLSEVINRPKRFSSPRCCTASASWPSGASATSTASVWSSWPSNRASPWRPRRSGCWDFV